MVVSSWYLSSKGFIDLKLVNLIQRVSSLVQEVVDCRDRSVSHRLRLAPSHAIPHNLCQGLEVILVQGMLIAEDQSSCSIADPRRAPGGDQAILLEDGWQLGKSLHCGLRLGVLVSVKGDHSLPGLHLDRGNLVLEHSGIISLLPPELRQERVLIHLQPAQVVLGPELLSSQTHGHLDIAVTEGGPQHVIGLRDLAQLHAEPEALEGKGAVGHVVRPAGQDNVGVPHCQILDAVDNGLEARPAQLADGEAGDLLPASKPERRVTVEVEGAVGDHAMDVANTNRVDRSGLQIAGSKSRLGGLKLWGISGS